MINLSLVLKEGACLLSFLFILNCIPCNATDIYFYNSQAKRPLLETFGLNHSLILYEQFFYEEGEDRTKPIRPKKMKEIYQRIEQSNSDVIHIDIEAWLGKGISISSTYIDRYYDLITDLKSHFPNKHFSYYDVVPTWAHWYIEKNPLRKLNWSYENQRRQKIADASDAINPCLYTYHETYEEWESWANVILQEAKKMANGKPVIPFIWPKFHQSAINPAHAENFLPRDYWKKQLSFLATHADGMIVWTDDLQGTWDSKSEWWQELNFFIKTNKNQPTAAQ